MPLSNQQHALNKLDMLLTKHIDMAGRRVIGAGDAVADKDYVTLKQSRSLIARIIAPILDSISNVYKFRDSAGKSFSNIIVGNYVNIPAPGIEGRIFIPVDIAAPPEFLLDDGLTWVPFNHFRPY